MQRAYRQFDVTRIYPLSRGLAPTSVAIVALAALDQSLSILQWVGVLLMGLALAVLLGDGTNSDRPVLSARPALWSAGIAATIAAYTSFDGWAIVTRGIDPLPYYALGATLQLALITVVIRGDVRQGLAQFRRHTPR